MSGWAFTFDGKDYQNIDEVMDPAILVPIAERLRECQSALNAFGGDTLAHSGDGAWGHVDKALRQVLTAHAERVMGHDAEHAATVAQQVLDGVYDNGESVAYNLAWARKNEYVATAAEVAAAVEQMKREVLDDIDAGRVDASVADFSALHDHVDANMYGGFTEDRAHWSTDSLNDAQNLVHGWLEDGRPMTCTRCGSTIERFRKHWWTGDDFMCPDGEAQHTIDPAPAQS